VINICLIKKRINYRVQTLGRSNLWPWLSVINDLRVEAWEEEEEKLKMADVGNKHDSNATCDRLQEGRRYILCRKILK
jgi:hypothetical protein